MVIQKACNPFCLPTGFEEMLSGRDSIAAFSFRILAIFAIRIQYARGSDVLSTPHTCRRHEGGRE